MAAVLVPRRPSRWPGRAPRPREQAKCTTDFGSDGVVIALYANCSHARTASAKSGGSSDTDYGRAGCEPASKKANFLWLTRLAVLGRFDTHRGS
jgi:hypothetical protein